MIKTALLIAGILLSQLVAAQGDNLASIYKEIIALDGSYQKALIQLNLDSHMAAKEKTAKLVDRMEKITGGSLIHPASQCRAAAIYLQIARDLQWMTANSKYATATDKRIDEENMRDFNEKLRLCHESVKTRSAK